ncbi:LysR family transcriptional regulator [Hydrogenophaga sp.]|uniref:LysR family transcriptional regulator n=1 Tax=Hydrogenophaga sp. TaxID=1904254 RepID=UPI003F6D6CEB
MDRLSSMRVFQRVIDEGGFAAAGRALDISPAVVTRLVADLEDHLGTRLLHRTTRRLSLTEAGAAYLERVRPILQDVDEADALVSSQTTELAGVLRILAPPVLATHVLAPLVAGFRQAYPKIVLDIEVATYREPPIEDFDLTLIGADASFDANVIARRINVTEAILVAAPSYLAGRPAPQVPEGLLHHACLRIKPEGLGKRPWTLFRSDRPEEKAELEVQPVLWANHTDTLLGATLGGAGISAIPVELAAPHLASGALVRVLSPWIAGRFTLYAALPSRKFMPQRTRVFLDYLSVQTQRSVLRALAACEGC